MINPRAYFTEDEWNETPRERAVRMAETRQKKLDGGKKLTPGVCPKCKKKIGRGIAFHIKGCKA